MVDDFKDNMCSLGTIISRNNNQLWPLHRTKQANLCLLVSLITYDSGSQCTDTVISGVCNSPCE